MRRRAAAAAVRQQQDYLDLVTAVLAAEFNWEPATGEALRRRLGASPATGFEPTLEFICDHPGVANWRLKADGAARPWGLRLAYYVMNESDATEERVNRVNAALRAAGTNVAAAPGGTWRKFR